MNSIDYNENGDYYEAISDDECLDHDNVDDQNALTSGVSHERESFTLDFEALPFVPKFSSEIRNTVESVAIADTVGSNTVALVGNWATSSSRQCKVPSTSSQGDCPYFPSEQGAKVVSTIYSNTNTNSEDYVLQQNPIKSVKQAIPLSLNLTNHPPSEDISARLQNESVVLELPPQNEMIGESSSLAFASDNDRHQSPWLDENGDPVPGAFDCIRSEVKEDPCVSIVNSTRVEYVFHVKEKKDPTRDAENIGNVNSQGSEIVCSGSVASTSNLSLEIENSSASVGNSTNHAAIEAYDQKKLYEASKNKAEYNATIEAASSSATCEDKKLGSAAEVKLGERYSRFKRNRFLDSGATENPSATADETEEEQAGPSTQRVKTEAEVALESQALTEILREVKQGAQRAKEYGALGWQKCPIPVVNKTFLRNTLVSTLRKPYKPPKKKGQRHVGLESTEAQTRESSSSSSRSRSSSRSSSSSGHSRRSRSSRDGQSGSKSHGDRGRGGFNRGGRGGQWPRGGHPNAYCDWQGMQAYAAQYGYPWYDPQAYGMYYEEGWPMDTYYDDPSAWAQYESSYYQGFPPPRGRGGMGRGWGGYGGRWMDEEVYSDDTDFSSSSLSPSPGPEDRDLSNGPSSKASSRQERKRSREKSVEKVSQKNVDDNETNGSGSKEMKKKKKKHKKLKKGDCKDGEGTVKGKNSKSNEMKGKSDDNNGNDLALNTEGGKLINAKTTTKKKGGDKTSKGKKIKVVKKKGKTSESDNATVILTAGFQKKKKKKPDSEKKKKGKGKAKGKTKAKKTTIEGNGEESVKGDTRLLEDGLRSPSLLQTNRQEDEKHVENTAIGRGRNTNEVDLLPSSYNLTESISETSKASSKELVVAPMEDSQNNAIRAVMISQDSYQNVSSDTVCRETVGDSQKQSYSESNKEGQENDNETDNHHERDPHKLESGSDFAEETIKVNSKDGTSRIGKKNENAQKESHSQGGQKRTKNKKGGLKRKNDGNESNKSKNLVKDLKSKKKKNRKEMEEGYCSSEAPTAKKKRHEKGHCNKSKGDNGQEDNVNEGDRNQGGYKRKRDEPDEKSEDKKRKKKDDEHVHNKAKYRNDQSEDNESNTESQRRGTERRNEKSGAGDRVSSNERRKRLMKHVREEEGKETRVYYDAREKIQEKKRQRELESRIERERAALEYSNSKGGGPVKKDFEKLKSDKSNATSGGLDRERERAALEYSNSKGGGGLVKKDFEKTKRDKSNGEEVVRHKSKKKSRKEGQNEANSKSNKDYTMIDRNSEIKAKLLQSETIIGEYDEEKKDQKNSTNCPLETTAEVTDVAFKATHNTSDRSKSYNFHTATTQGLKETSSE